MKKQVYTLKKRKDTGELHLFEAYQESGSDSCIPDQESICKKMKKDESEKNLFACQNEDKARNLAANQGRKVCGVCISHLYATY